jgi:predicted Zn-dependent protease
VHNKTRLNIARRLWLQPNRVVRTWGLTLCSLFLLSCSLIPSISVVRDDGIERLVREEAGQILAISEDAANTSLYQIFLSDFPRGDILGMSIGQRRIYISYKLGSRALYSQRHLWLLRQTLAHEIAHEIAGHANYRQVNFNRSTAERGMTSRDLGLPWYVTFQPYSMEKELQADLDGMRYWQRLQWNCAIWVRILQDFERQNYAGDISHPTQSRLQQALNACRSESELSAQPGSARQAP